MLPMLAASNSGNLALADAKPFCHFNLSDLKFGADNLYVRICQHGAAIGNSFWRLPSLLFFSVFRVIGWCPREKMVRIDAARIIAPMANILPWKNGPAMKLITNAVRKLG